MSWQDDPISTPAWQSDPIMDHPAERGMGQEIARQAGLTGRYATEGVLALPGMIANIPAVAMNKILDATEHLSGKKIDYRFPDQNQAISNALTSAGLPQPESKSEQVIGAAARGIAGAGAGMGLGSLIANEAAPVAQGIGRVMQASPVQQGIGGATGGTAAEVTRQQGGGPIAQTIAGLAGGMAPALVATGAPAAVKQTLRGGEAGRQAMQENIDTFNAVGTQPSVGQATQGRLAQATESLLSKTPGSAGVMAKRAGDQAGEIQQGLENIADGLSKKTSAEQAGRKIIGGITGDKGFTENFKATQQQLYDKLDGFIQPLDRVPIDKTKEALATLNADIPGAPNVSEFFKNAKIKGIDRAVKADTEGMSSIEANPALADAFKGSKLGAEDQALLKDFLVDGKLPYQAVKKLRTLVGNELSDSWAGSDVPRSKWNALYAALSSDLEGAAKTAGPKATQAWERANSYTRAGMDRLDAISHVLDKNGGPEKVFSAALSGTSDGATTLRAVMQSLPKDGQKTLSATVIRKLGAANNSAQNDIGDKFSTETFLTNWNKLSDEAKRTLFDRYGSGFRDNMDQVAKVASNLRAGSKVFVNPSGTGQATAQTAAVTSFVVSALTGHPGTASAIAGGAGAANLSARLMTNPNFVKWLAGTTKTPIAMTPAMINALAQEGRKKADPDLLDAADFLKQGLTQ